MPAHFGLPARAFRDLRASSACTEKVLDDLQLEAERLLARLNLGIRLGPMFGLAGTLIPLGPALTALSAGDFGTLSMNLVVAFTTTVLGLIVGGVCFAIHAVRRVWYMQDLNDIESIARRLPGDAKHPTARGGDSRPASRSRQPV
ncbi:MAG: MotA/TolQ/ExbB proton channel family protein [Planctomycetes bacterium]|nr:MotA/TolQ/ExbB proton channel family protein [Planctomycetota bacterium]